MNDETYSTLVRLNQGYGARIQILGSGSSSSHMTFLAPALALEKIWSIENKKPLYYLCNSLAPQTMSVERELKFQAPPPPSKIF